MHTKLTTTIGERRHVKASTQDKRLHTTELLQGNLKSQIHDVLDPTRSMLFGSHVLIQV
jgi:hypothetical protein